MSKDKIADYDGATAGNNTDIGGISIDEGMLPSTVNNSMRELTRQLGAFADGTDGIDVLNLHDDDASASIKIQAPATVTTTTTFTLPDGDGTSGYALVTNGSGQLSWASAAGIGNVVEDTTPQLGGNLDLNSNNITGTGNIDVTGTVTADGLDVQGDGTISGGSRLTISNIADENNDGIRLDDSTTSRFNNLTQDSSGNFKIQHWTGSAWQNNLTVTTGGNVGISNTAPDFNLSVGNSSSVNPSIQIMSATNSNAQLLFGDGAGAAGYRGTIVYGNATDSMSFSTAGAERMRLTSAGLLGLGVTAPDGKLNVVSTAHNNGSIFDSTGTTQLWLRDTDAASNQKNWGFQVSGGDLNIVRANDDRASGFVTPIYIQQAPANSLVIDTNGNVGIGTVPLAKFHVNSTNSAFYMGYGGNEDIYLQTTNGNVLFTNKGATTERMRLTSGGNVGIGTSSPGKLMHLSAGNDSASLRLENTANSKVWEITPANPGVANSGLSIYNVTDNAVALHVDNSNNVGIGVSSMTNKLVLPNAAYFAMQDTGGAESLAIRANTSNAMEFLTGGGERGRFSATGSLLVGQSSTSTPGVFNTTQGAAIASTGRIHSSVDGSYSSFNRNGSDGVVIQLHRQGSGVGQITVNSSGTTYNTTSDIRLKQDIEPLQATDKLMDMNPVSYNWKVDPDGPRSMGFIAQEMRSVMPEAVSTGDDDDAMMSMDYGRITPILVSALQDAHRKIEQLEQRLADMEAK